MREVGSGSADTASERSQVDDERSRVNAKTVC
jgi:hypothetical protein